MNLGERIALARKHAKLTQPGLAERLSGLMTQQNISLLERGITKGTEYIVQIAMVCEVRPEWLATGQGEMTATINRNYENSPEAKVLIAMQHMDEATKYQLLKISNSLAEPAEPNNKHDTQ